jgi:Kef-type K+ transport system membrane component KefB
MDPLTQFLLSLAIIIIVAKAGGYLSVRLGQPAVLGELLVGLVLGPSALDMLHWPLFGTPTLEEIIYDLAQLGVLFLMFIAGLEVELDAMRRAGRPALWAGSLGVVAPILAGLALLPFGFDLEHSIFIGLVLAATSVSISAQTLMELGVLRSRVGMALLGGAVVDDVLALVALSLFLALTGDGGGAGIWAVVWAVLRMLLFVAVAAWAGIRFLPQLSAWADRLPISQALMSLVFVVTLLYGWSAEALGGMAAITGAFMAGLLFGRTPLKRAIEPGMHTLAYAWLVPVFFVSIGLEANVRLLGAAGVPLAVLVVVLAIVSKLAGSGLGGWLGGLDRGEALRLGVGMMSRGEVGLIIATLGLTTGETGQDVFAIAVLVVLVTTLVTPIALRALYPPPVPHLAPSED